MDRLYIWKEGTPSGYLLILTSGFFAIMQKYHSVTDIQPHHITQFSCKHKAQPFWCWVCILLSMALVIYAGYECTRYAMRQEQRADTYSHKTRCIVAEHKMRDIGSMWMYMILPFRIKRNAVIRKYGQKSVVILIIIQVK